MPYIMCTVGPETRNFALPLVNGVCGESPGSDSGSSKECSIVERRKLQKPQRRVSPEALTASQVPTSLRAIACRWENWERRPPVNAHWSCSPLF